MWRDDRWVKELSIRFPTWPAGSWMAYPDQEPFVADQQARPGRRTSAVIWQELGNASERGLPVGCPDLDDLFDECEQLLVNHYEWSEDHGVDVTMGWNDDEARQRFVARVRELERELSRALRPEWSVSVDPDPGLVMVRVAGEYGCDWPLWISGGGTSAESWPQLSTTLVDRLHDWALRADPDHYPHPGVDETEKLRRDLAAELGPHFVVTTRR